MSLITYKCPKCSAEIRTDESLVGEEMKCAFCGEKSKIPIPGVYSGMNLGGFIVERQLGVGGMGEVWLARQEKLDRHVALKILSPKYTSNPSFVERFMSEVRNTAKLEHPNIVTAFHAGVENGIYYMAISYVYGETVFDKIKDGNPISEKEALEIVRSVAGALDYAWSEYKILHRDIKPSNIMIDKKSVPKLMDMGISKSLNEESSLTMTGIMIGTPYYISPEQAIGAKDIDFRADIYSLGATLYHMVTGNVPYDASTAMAIISKHLSEPLPDPRNYNSTLSEETVALIKIMMAKDKNDRQSSWRALIEDTERVLKGEFPLTPLPDSKKTTIATFSAANSPASGIDSVTSAGEKTEIYSSVGSSSASSSPNTYNEKNIKNNRKKNNLFIIALLLIVFILALAIATAGSYFLYKYFAKDHEKRKKPLPTEQIVKPNSNPVLNETKVQDNVKKTTDSEAHDSAQQPELSDFLKPQDISPGNALPAEEKNGKEKLDIPEKTAVIPTTILPESDKKKESERQRPNW